MIKKSKFFLGCCMVLISLTIQAQSNYGAEIVSKQKFGEGLMVTRAKIVPISGTVSNIFFFNRENEPWNGNVWYEYDWEIRGKYPENGWSQIRVRSENGARLIDEPENISTSVNLGNNLYNYILIRKDNTYVYDIRKDFDIDSYDYENSSSHGNNSKSLIEGGARIYKTGNGVDHIPENKQLDFNIGITAFDSNWAGSLPDGSYAGDLQVDYSRFYGFNNNGSINKSAQWVDEFNSDRIDNNKWQVANWESAKTQFREENIRFENGSIILRISNDASNTNSGQLVENGTYVIKGSNNQHLGSPSNDNNVSMVNANNNEDTNQWIFNYLGDDKYTIKNVGSNRYLEVPYGKCGKRVNVATYTKVNRDWHRWIVSKIGNDFFLQPAHCTSHALDKNNGNSNNVHLWSLSTNNVNQKWEITPINNRFAASINNLESNKVDPSADIPVTLNAVQQVLNINLSNYLDQSINYFVGSINGQILAKGIFNKNHSNIEALKIENLATGTFFIYLKPENHESIVQKFIIVEN